MRGSHGVAHGWGHGSHGGGFPLTLPLPPSSSLRVPWSSPVLSSFLGFLLLRCAVTSSARQRLHDYSTISGIMWCWHRGHAGGSRLLMPAGAHIFEGRLMTDALSLACYELATEENRRQEEHEKEIRRV